MSSSIASLHVVLDASCEIANTPGGKYDKVGLAIETNGLCIALGHGQKTSMHPLPSIRKVHAKFIGSGKLTFEVATTRGATKQILISKARPEDLRGLLETLDHATKMARARSVSVLPQDDAVVLLQKRYPAQVNKQLAELRAAAVGGDVPQPNKGHTRVMLMVDGGSMSPSQAGKELGMLAKEDFGLTVQPRPGECNAQTHVSVAKNAAREPQLLIRVRQCIHHRWANALWLDIDAGPAIEVSALRASCVKWLCAGDETRLVATTLAHGAVKEKLAMGLAVHLRSGTLKVCGALRSSDANPPPLP